MDVYVDNDRNVALEGNPSDLLSVVAALNNQLRARGRTILSLHVDGKDIPPDNLAEMGSRTLDSVSRIDVVSEDIAVLVGEALREMDEVLPELPRACHMLASVFQGGSPTDGYVPFEKLAEVWGTLISRQLQIASLCECPIDELAAGAVPARRLHEELNGFLEEAAAALQSGDCVLLGDLLEYELAPRAEAEAQIVAALRKRVEANAARA
jgi:hypothetical protein